MTSHHCPPRLRAYRQDGTATGRIIVEMLEDCVCPQPLAVYDESVDAVTPCGQGVTGATE